MVSEATRLVTGAGGVTPKGNVCFSSEVAAGAFVPSQLLNFGSLAYVVDCYGELCRPPQGDRAGGQ